MRAMMLYTFSAHSTQPATAGMRAMPQGVIGGARTQRGMKSEALKAVKRQLSEAAARCLAGNPRPLQEVTEAMVEVSRLQARQFRSCAWRWCAKACRLRLQDRAGE